MHWYTQHTNLELVDVGDKQLKGDCIFCGKEDHFHISDKEENKGQWDCKLCKRTGNVYSFLTLFHADKCIYEPVERLAEERRIPKSFFRFNEVKWNSKNSTYVIPTYNQNGKLNNLYKAYRNPDGGLNIINTSGLPSTLFGLTEHIREEVWLCEGMFDKIAGDAIVGGARQITCIGYPGSGFKATWAQYLVGKKVVIFGDNDPAGSENIKTILKHIEAHHQKPTSVKAIKYPDGLPRGYDLNDIYKDHGSGSYSWIQDHLVPCETVGAGIVADNLIVADTHCDTFDKLVNSCESAYHFTEDMELLLILLLSSLYSLKVEGEQLWLRVIGPPGSSKTTLAKVIGASEQTVLRDTFTGLLSGWKDDEAGDASLIPLIAGKALIVKDADALLKQPNIGQILSELRAFYDKDTAATYRNRVSFDYKNIRSVFQLNGTHALRGIDNAALGDRFLDFELKVTDDDREKISDRMYERSYTTGHTGLSPENSVWEHAKGFIDHHLLNRTGVSFLTDVEKRNIKNYCQLTAYMRAKVEWTRDGRIAYQPHAEVPSRLIGQFTKLYMCAPRVLDATTPSEKIHALVRRVARDVMDTESARYKLCDGLVRVGNSMSRDDLVKLTGLSYDTVNRELLGMVALNMLELSKKRLDSNTSINFVRLKDQLHSQFESMIDKT